MDSKSKRIDRFTCLCALSGLLFGAILSVYLNGSEETLNITRLGDSLAELPGDVIRSIKYGVFELAMKFLHFFISKWMQFRFISPFDHQHHGSFSKSALFWVSLTRSVFSSYVPIEPLQ